MQRKVIVLVGVALALCLPASAQLDLKQELRRKFEVELHRVDAAFDGVAAAEFIDISSGEKIGFNAAAQLPTASVIKVPVLVELFRQAESNPDLLAGRRTIGSKNQVAGSGLLRLFGDGTSALALEDIAKLMINISDNSAANIVIDEVGMNNVNSLLATLGLRQTKLARHMMDSAAQARGEDNVSSAADGAELMSRIARCDLPVSKDSCAKIRRILEIPQEAHPSKDPIPRQIAIAFKWGGNDGVSAAWAIVNQPARPYVMSIMTTYAGDAAPTVRALSAAAWAYYSRLAGANAYGTRVLR